MAQRMAGTYSPERIKALQGQLAALANAGLLGAGATGIASQAEALMPGGGQSIDAGEYLINGGIAATVPLLGAGVGAGVGMATAGPEGRLLGEMERHIAEAKMNPPRGADAELASLKRAKELNARAVAMHGPGVSSKDFVTAARLRGMRRGAAGALIGGAAASIPALAYMFNDGNARPERAA